MNIYPFPQKPENQIKHKYSKIPETTMSGVPYFLKEWMSEFDIVRYMFITSDTPYRPLYIT